MSEYIIDTDGYYEISIYTVERDGIPVVRCKDCKHYVEIGYAWNENNIAEYNSCLRFSDYDEDWDFMGWLKVESNNFCCWGEEKNNESI